MNWLDPREVEALLKRPRFSPDSEENFANLDWACGQFVRALAARRHEEDCESDEGHSECCGVWAEKKCDCLYGVARLLGKAMEGE